ncbi:MAG: DUF1343 domain-containing protein [Armatimonadetes bacterium]|nr:DUF1343 domain-containing protein [Armatimonadota bacterium]
MPRRASPFSLQQIDALVESAIEAGDIPGGVVLVGCGEEVLHKTVRGLRRLVPSPQPMEEDTLFDLASLTKPIVTATLAMQLIEAGEMAASDPVSRYVRQFPHEHVLIRDLLTHSSGLPAWKGYLANPPTDAEDRNGRLQAVVDDICSTPLQAPAGTRFIYSDLGFILLGYIIEMLASSRLDELAVERLFTPAAMSSACFNPPSHLAQRCAATEVVDGQVLQGRVHDENARYLCGVAGHAGLFASAMDLAEFCRAMLRFGQGRKGQFLSPAAVSAMTSPQSRHPGNLRGFGWDIASDYSVSLRGDLFPVRGFGHSGFTGTSVWIDPPSGIWIVVLTNRVHPTRENNRVLGLRKRVANVVAAALLAAPAAPRLLVPRGRVMTGLEVQASSGWPAVRGKRIGLIANASSVDRDRRHMIDLLAEAEGTQLVRIFAPEHGLRSELDEKFADGTDARTGLPVVSLYGERLAPEPEHLADLDALVFDIQDVGVRFYTYTATMVLAMREAAKAGIEFVVLDRPPMLPASAVAGPVLDKPFDSLAAYHPLPVLHGLTPGELAQFANHEYGIGARLTVVPCQGYTREFWFDQTGLPWVNPSPNLKTLKAVALYPALGMLERCNISVGRGTHAPFEYFGAPWMDGRLVAERLNDLDPPGVSFVPVVFTPQTREFAGQLCSGCYVVLHRRDSVDPVRLGVEIAWVVHSLYPQEFGVRRTAPHLSHRAAERLANLEPVDRIVGSWEEELAEYMRKRQPYLLY